jgi:hypothetical protein
MLQDQAAPPQLAWMITADEGVDSAPQTPPQLEMPPLSDEPMLDFAMRIAPEEVNNTAQLQAAALGAVEDYWTLVSRLVQDVCYVRMSCGCKREIHLFDRDCIIVPFMPACHEHLMLSHMSLYRF